MARNSSGNYALPSPQNPVITKSVITTDWANTTLQDIANEVTQSLDRNGKGDMLAPVRPPVGTAAAPAHTFSTDTNTGIFGAAADTLGFSAGGTLRAEIGVNGLLTVDGALATPALSFLADPNTGIYRAGADDLRIAAGGVDVAKFTTKLSASAAVAATGGTRQDALSLTNGDLDLSAVAYPTSTTAVSNRLTPANLVKAWVTLSIAGGNGGNFTVTKVAGFNIASVARASSTRFTLTFGSAFADTNYAIWGQMYGAAATTLYCLDSITSNVGSAVIGLAGSAAGAIDLDADATLNNRLTIFFLGAQ